MDYENHGDFIYGKSLFSKEAQNFELFALCLFQRWEWNFGQGGLIELCGMLHCGICMRSVIYIISNSNLNFHKDDWF